MQFKDFLAQRESVREYAMEPIARDTLGELLDYAEMLENKVDGGKLYNIVFFREGMTIYEKLQHIGGYSGVMIKSPSYFGVRMADEKPETIVGAAYLMQDLIKKAFELGLGTCWVDVGHVPQETAIEIAGGVDRVVKYLFAIGYPAKEGFFESKTKVSQKTGANKFDIDRLMKGSGSEKIDVEDLVYLNEFGNKTNFETLEQWGVDELFLFVRYAPSHLNSQPCRFILDNDKVTLCLLNGMDEANLTDAGIMMYLFEGLAHEAGMKARWKLDIQPAQKFRDKEYRVVGTFDM